MGFWVFAPMMPHQLQMLVLGKVGGRGSPLPMVFAGLLLFIVFTLVFGRLFCGFICPVRAIQELAYKTPAKKLRITNKPLQFIFHLIFFIAFIVLGIAFSIAILSYLGFEDFFHVNTKSPFFYVFAVFSAHTDCCYRLLLSKAYLS